MRFNASGEVTYVFVKSEIRIDANQLVTVISEYEFFDYGETEIPSVIVPGEY